MQMAKQFDKDLVNLAVDYVQGTYKITDILDEYNVNYPDTGSNEIVISCFGHSDSSPSLGINRLMNKFHCLSCGKGGNIVDLKVFCENSILNRKTTFTAVLEKMLKEDPIMQLRVGASSIMKKNKDSIGIDELKIRRSVSFREVSQDPKTFPELSRKLKSKYSGNVDLLLISIDYMEKGMAPEEIYRLICDTAKSSVKAIPLSEVNVSDLLGENDD